MYPTISDNGNKAYRHFLLSSISNYLSLFKSLNFYCTFLIPNIYPPLLPVISLIKSPIIDSGIVNSTFIKGSSKQGLDLDKSSLTINTLLYWKIRGFLLLKFDHLPSSTVTLVFTIGNPKRPPLNKVSWIASLKAILCSIGRESSDL